MTEIVIENISGDARIDAMKGVLQEKIKTCFFILKSQYGLASNSDVRITAHLTSADKFDADRFECTGISEQFRQALANCLASPTELPL